MKRIRTMKVREPKAPIGVGRHGDLAEIKLRPYVRIVKVGDFGGVVEIKCFHCGLHVSMNCGTQRIRHETIKNFNDLHQEKFDPKCGHREEVHGPACPCKKQRAPKPEQLKIPGVA